MSKFALNIGADGRILSATYEEFAPKDAVLVDELPEGNIADYRYEGGSYIHDPLPKVETEDTPSQLDRIEAQVAYTAMMTDTLLEV